MRCFWSLILTSLLCSMLSPYCWNNAYLAQQQRPVMIAQWDSSLSVLPVARVQFSVMVEYFTGYFPDWSHYANPSWASVAEHGSISPQWHHTTCVQLGGRSKSNHGQTMADRIELNWTRQHQHNGKNTNKKKLTKWLCHVVIPYTTWFCNLFKLLIPNDPLHYKKQWSTYYRSLCLTPLLASCSALNILVSKEEFIRLLK